MLTFPSGNLNPRGAVLHGSSLPRSDPFPLGRRGISPDFPDFPAEPIRPGPKARPPRFVSVQLRADKTSSPRSPGAARRAIKGARGATLAAPRRSDCGSPLSSELSPFSLSLVHVCSLAVLISVLVCVPVSVFFLQLAPVWRIPGSRNGPRGSCRLGTWFIPRSQCPSTPPSSIPSKP